MAFGAPRATSLTLKGFSVWLERQGTRAWGEVGFYPVLLYEPLWIVFLENGSVDGYIERRR